MRILLICFLIVNNPSVVNKTQIIPGISSDGHHAVYVEHVISLNKRQNPPRKIHMFRQADWQGLEAHKKTFCDNFMKEETGNKPVNELWETFAYELESAIDKFVPSKMTKTRERPT